MRIEDWIIDRVTIKMDHRIVKINDVYYIVDITHKDITVSYIVLDNFIVSDFFLIFIDLNFEDVVIIEQIGILKLSKIKRDICISLEFSNFYDMIYNRGHVIII